MKLLRKILSRNKKSNPLKATSDKLNKHSSVRELLSANEDLTLLVELTKSSNILFGIEWPSLTKMAFQDVHDILEHQNRGELFEMVKIITGKNIDDILELESGFFIKFVKWIGEQCKIIINLYGVLGEKEEFDEEDVAYQNAGSDKLNRYKEKMIYYSIDKNPVNWPAMERIPFEVMFTKLLIDKDLGSINKKYAKLMTKKNG